MFWREINLNLLNPNQNITAKFIKIVYKNDFLEETKISCM